MIESRCGNECSKCEYKDKMNCKGCVNIDKAFWGECEVKFCCESKKLENCGMCKEFPCDLLKAYSYDEQQGNNGLSIEQCKIWCGRE